MKKKAMFLDRDGVINVEKNYVHKIEDFEFIDGVFESLGYFQQQGYLLIIITNQAGIGRGYYSEKDFYILNNWMLKQFELQGIKISKVYFSPYHPTHGIGVYKKDSFCRKPNPGLILQAQRDFQLDLSKSILVGDKETDIEAGINARVKMNILVKTGHKTDVIDTKANLVIDNLKELVRLFELEVKP